jgi:hypothetical protein
MVRQTSLFPGACWRYRYACPRRRRPDASAYLLGRHLWRRDPSCHCPGASKSAGRRQNAGTTPNASSLGIGGGIWWVISSCLALFVGGYVAAWLAGVGVRFDGLLHGLLTWGIAILLTIYLLTSAIGGIIGGGFSALGSAAAKESIINIMAAQMKISHDDAAKQFNDTQAKLQQAKDKAVQTAKNAAPVQPRRLRLPLSACCCWVGLLPRSVVYSPFSVVCERRSSSFARSLARPRPAREPACPIGAGLGSATNRTQTVD